MIRSILFRRLIPVALALLIGLAAVRLWAQELSGTVEVRVLSQAEVFGGQYNLGDIAEFDGGNLEIIAALARVTVGRSPLPGRSQKISRAYLMARLRREVGIVLDRVELNVPRGASVVRAAQLVPGEEISRIVMDHARQEISADAADFQQELLTPMQDVLLPKGELSWSVEPLGENLRRGGRRSYRISARVNGEEAWRGIVRVRQSVYSDILVAARPLRRQQVISASDVRTIRRSLHTLKGGPYITTPGEAIGKRVMRPVGKGEMLQSSMLTVPADIREGGRVTLEYRTAGLTLRAPGVALVSARVGQFIPVRNLESGKVVHGILRPGDLIRVN